ncbi:alpha/beta fold hydrolase [Couchioplanes caeruleus]|uniref:Aminopeptidase n=2 Tax=Couchioplanes caeruleus TaxID=56438 RepID=A0A1K0G1V7_9ACTN|nr:alpha/beta hydrolase [Couchioplanes caeruleus]OJF11282.1 aminopeptidase [Couchioplanes caeruleus subsp. caeruleus]
MNLLRLATALAASASWGVAAGLWTPRGPLTTAQALWSIAISLAVGYAAGRLTRSRWALIGGPVAYAVAVELTRAAVTGPSVDAPHLSVFGLMALLAGRGVHGLLALLPLALGAAYGRGPRSRILVGATTVVLALVTVGVAIPARTPAIPGGVAELVTVDANGHRLGVMIRGGNPALPVLLFVPGTPGGSEKGAARRHLAALEEHFVVATLDRRGGGSSYATLDPTSTVTVDDAVADIVAVTDHLRERFEQQKIYLLGFSGGSVLATLAAHRHPDRFRAYIGTGQAVDLKASDQIFYADIMAWARSTGHDDVADQLTAQGPPPYADFWSYEPILLHENEAYAQGEPALETGAGEFTLLEKAHSVNAIMDTWHILYPRMQDTDLRREVPALSIPAYFVQGSQEMRGLAVIFDQWYATLRSPDKGRQTIPGGHRALFEHPEEFATAVTTLLAPP